MSHRHSVAIKCNGDDHRTIGFVHISGVAFQTRIAMMQKSLHFLTNVERDGGVFSITKRVLQPTQSCKEHSYRIPAETPLVVKDSPSLAANTSSYSRRYLPCVEE